MKNSGVNRYDCSQAIDCNHKPPTGIQNACEIHTPDEYIRSLFETRNWSGIEAVSDWRDLHIEVLDSFSEDIQRKSLKPTGRSG